MPSRDAVRILATATMAVAVLIPCAVIGSEEDEEPSFGERFERSLHATRSGKAYWYGADRGGFEKITGVPIDRLGCAGCHAQTDAAGKPYADPYPGASCSDCHREGDRAVSSETCLGCHGRQALEIVKLKLPDVHREAGMECSDCHAGADVHGDGKRYRSMLEAGAIQADCETCHPADALPASHARNDPHGGALHCSACHAETVVSCYNCHFESQVQAGVKRALRPIHGFVLLVNRSKDGKVHPATFQTLTYGGKSFVALAPYSAHTITAEGRACAACHGTRNDSGLRFSWWNEESSGIEWRRGVVPVPEDWPSSLRMAFLSFEADPATPAGEANEAWSPLDSERADLAQMLFARPLRPEQIEKMVRPVD